MRANARTTSSDAGDVLAERTATSARRSGKKIDSSLRASRECRRAVQTSRHHVELRCVHGKHRDVAVDLGVDEVDVRVLLQQLGEPPPGQTR
jgi:hypothetical protein